MWLNQNLRQLRMDNSNINSLMTVLAVVHVNPEMVAEVNDTVNLSLAQALKKNQIRGKDLSLVLNYLKLTQASPLFYKYAILRVHQSMRNCALQDVASALENANALDDEE